MNEKIARKYSLILLVLSGFGILALALAASVIGDNGTRYGFIGVVLGIICAVLARLAFNLSTIENTD